MGFACLSLVLIFVFASCASENRRPRFPNTILVVRTIEGQPNGSTIAIARANDPDGNRVMYSLGADAAGRFRINMGTGELMLNTVLDREKVEIAKFTIYAFDNIQPQKKTSLRVSVHVQDINDNSPVFVGTPYEKELSEDAPVGSFVIKLTATDADEIKELIYKIVDGNIENAFKINNYGGKITTRKKLDFEKIQKYYLNVSVEDARPSAPVRHVTYTILTISVKDIDDNGAAFTSNNYTSHIREGELKNVYVNRVEAHDIDKGLNAPVIYSLNKDNDPEGIFSIDAKTGFVYADGQVDREVKSKYVIEVFAKCTNHPVAKSLLVVYVDDINDNGPKFVKPSYSEKIMENSNIGTTVLQVSATDADIGDGTSSPIHYEILIDENTFAVNDEGYIFVNDTLDHEKKSLYDFRVIARQEEKPQTSAYVTIRVLDENDNNPIFQYKNPEIPLYRGSVSEYAQPGTQIVKVHATDKDSDVNSVVTYSIIPDALGFSNRFRIDSISGWIYSAVKLDREDHAAYSVLVKATDNAKKVEERRSATTIVNITILDENDFRPFFEKTDIAVKIFQDLRLRTTVAKVKAIDRDAGNYGRLKYFFFGDKNLLFSLNSKTGKIKVAESLMAYAGKTYKLVIGARDNPGGTVLHTSSNYATVTIKIYQASVDVLCLSKNSMKMMKSKAETFRRELQELLQLDVDLVEIVEQESQAGSEVKFNAYNKTTRKVMSRPDVLRIYHSIDKDAVDSFNAKWNITVWKVPEVASSGSSSSIERVTSREKKKTNMTLYIIVGVSSVVAICGIIGIIYAVNAKRKYYGEANPTHSTERMIKFRNNLDNSSYWCGSHEDFNTSHRLTITSDLPDLIEMYGDQDDEEEPLANNNTTEEEIIIGKQLSRYDSKASSIPFANSSCGTIYKAPSLASNCSQVPSIVGKSPRRSRRRRRRGAMGRMSSSEPQLLVKRLSIVLDTDIDIIGGRRYPGTARRFHMGSTQGTC